MQISELNRHLEAIRDHDRYSNADSSRKVNDGFKAIREEFIKLRAEADERDGLRELLITKGIDNAQLTVRIAELDELLLDARSKIPVKVTVTGPTTPEGDKA